MFITIILLNLAFGKTKHLPNNQYSKLRYTKQLSVSKTKGEWSLIQEKVIAAGKKDLNAYIRCEAMKIKKAFKKNPSWVTYAKGERIEKRPYLPLSMYEDLDIIAMQMKIPVSTLIDRLIIEPMLLPKL